MAKFEWTDQKIDIAAALAKGEHTQKEIAEQFGVRTETISRWRHHEEFSEKIIDYTSKHDMATRAGLLNEALLGLNKKRKFIDKDKSTHLDYIKIIADIVGANKQTIEHIGDVTIEYVPAKRGADDKTPD